MLRNYVRLDRLGAEHFPRSPDVLLRDANDTPRRWALRAGTVLKQRLRRLEEPPRCNALAMCLLAFVEACGA